MSHSKATKAYVCTRNESYPNSKKQGSVWEELVFIVCQDSSRTALDWHWLLVEVARDVVAFLAGLDDSGSARKYQRWKENSPLLRVGQRR